MDSLSKNKLFLAQTNYNIHFLQNNFELIYSTQAAASRPSNLYLKSSAI